LAHAGRIADGLALVEAGIEPDGGWGTPELLPLKGELFLVSIPRQSRGLYVVSRSKRLSGALTRPRLI
jgi:hypothetical protein